MYWNIYQITNCKYKYINYTNRNKLSSIKSLLMYYNRRDIIKNPILKDILNSNEYRMEFIKECGNEIECVKYIDKLVKLLGDKITILQENIEER